MFNRTTDSESELQKTIDEINLELRTHDAHSDEYDVCLKRLERLYKLKDQDRPKRVSPDVVVTAGTNLIGIAMILQYERIHVITSKALGFVQKLR